MPIRPNTSEYAGMNDYRQLFEDVERLKRGEFARTPAVDELRIGDCRFTVEKGGTGTRDGVVLSVTNVRTGSTAVLAALP